MVKLENQNWKIHKGKLKEISVKINIRVYMNKTIKLLSNWKMISMINKLKQKNYNIKILNYKHKYMEKSHIIKKLNTCMNNIKYNKKRIKMIIRI